MQHPPFPISAHGYARYQTDSGDIADMHWMSSSPSSISCRTADSSQRSVSQPSDSSQALLISKRTKPGWPSNLTRGYTTGPGPRARKSKPCLPPGETPHRMVLEGWVDDEYRSENPWYGQAKKTPVFSLGRPLPHTASQVIPLKRGDIESQEPVPVTPTKTKLGSRDARKVRGRQTETLGRVGEKKAKSTGATRNRKCNEAEQPAFDYVPFEDTCDNDISVTSGIASEETIRPGTGNTADEPSYKINSAPLGKTETDEVERGKKDPDELRNWWARVRARHPEPLAEFLATGVAIFLGLSATLSVNLTANERIQYGTYDMTCWAWGFAWMFGIYLGGGISGAHMNPVISISLAIFRGFPWRSCALYIAVQFLAAIAAGALAWGIYKDTIAHLDPTMENTSRSFFSTPQEHVSFGTAFLSQVVGSAILVIAIFALGDDQNNPPGAGMHAFVLGLLITILRFSLGYTAGAALNPASDFGPRLIAYAMGCRQPNVFQSMWWLYGPWIASMIGCIVGCSIYDGMIFVGSESPINYRIPEKFRKRTRKLFRGLVTK